MNDDNQDNQLIRYRGRVAYDGSKFQGFQIQLGKRNARSVQGTLEEVLQQRFNRDDIRVVGAGRTDAGVHARGQAFHFDLRPEEHAQLSPSSSSSSSPSLVHKDDEAGQRQLPPLDYTMNRMLTDEIRVWNVGPAPPPVEKVLPITHPEETRNFSWNAIHDTTMKLYSYRICVGPAMDPIWRHQRWQVPADGNTIDIALLKRVLSHYEGTHDFRPFAGAVEQLEKRTQRQLSTHRTIYKCELIDESDMYGGKDGGYYRVDILLQGALYKMVRNMVGTALEVSKGRMEESTFLKLLQGNNKANSAGNEKNIGRKNNPAKPAPPEGLTLERVYYEDDGIF
jgi:tRNA pseudouridine38-40 synthase